MKKTIIAIFFCSASFAAFGQGEVSSFDSNYSSSSEQSTELSFTSKNGHEVLPREGDWALGIGASSLLGYFGDLFNGTANNGAPSFSETSRGIPGPSISIYGKKMVSDNYAYRASIDIAASTFTSRTRVDDDNSSNQDDYLFDKRMTSNYAIGLSGGFEHRRGHGRVQGIYGAEAYAYYSSGTTSKYEYANQITSSNQQPSSAGYGNPTSVPTPALGYRITNADLSNFFQGGLRAFVGVEYFFAPQISIGGEFFLGAGYTITGGQSITYEGFDGTASEVREYTNTIVGSNGLSVGTDNAGGSINLLFYF